MDCVIRVDSGCGIGYGHLSRCLTLALELRKQGAAVEFICRELPGAASVWVEQAGFVVHLLSEGLSSWQDDASATASVLKGRAPTDWLVVDHYGLDAQWERALRPMARKILVVDDLADRPHDCDGLLDQNLRDEGNPYSNLLPAGAAVFLGPRYALLREEFRLTAPPGFRHNGPIRRVMVFFGGSDPTGETLKALTGLEQIGGRQFTVDVVVGDANPDKDEIAARCAAMPQVNFHFQVADMARLLKSCDLALGAAGVSSWERLAMGVPAVLAVVADNQQENLRQLGKRGVALVLGLAADLTAEDWTRAVVGLMAEPERLRSMVEKTRGIVDGDGACRIAEWMIKAGGA